MDTVVLLKVVDQFICFSTPYLPTALTNTHMTLITFAIWLVPWQT